MIGIVLAGLLAAAQMPQYLAAATRAFDQAQVKGDSAALGGVADAKGISDGKPYHVRLRFADLWAKRDGHWQVIFTQARQLPSD